MWWTSRFQMNLGKRCHWENPYRSQNHQPSSSPVYSLVSLLMADLRLVNSTWKTSVTPFLYQTIQLSSATQASNLVATLQQFRGRRILIKTLIITIPPIDVQDHEAHPMRRT